MNNLIENNNILLYKIKNILGGFPNIKPYTNSSRYLTNYYDLFLKELKPNIQKYYQSYTNLEMKPYVINEYLYNSNSDIFDNILNLANFGASGIIFHFNNINIKLIFTSGISHALENEIYIPNYLISRDNSLEDFIVDIKAYEQDYDSTNIYYNLMFFILNIQYCFMVLSKDLLKYVKDDDKKIFYGTTLEEKKALKELKSICSHITDIVSNESVKNKFSFVLYNVYKKYLQVANHNSFDINLFNKIDRLIDFFNKIEKYQPRYNANLIITEKAISNALTCYFYKNKIGHTPIPYTRGEALINMINVPEYLDYTIFCMIICLIKIYKVTDGKFTHGDLKIDNLLVYPLNKEINMKIDKYTISIKEKFIVKLNDFDLSSIEDSIENQRLKKYYNEDKDNCNYPKGFFYDMHYFMHFIHKYKKIISTKLIKNLDDIFNYKYCLNNKHYCHNDRIVKYETRDLSILTNLLEHSSFEKWVFN